jgi:outer membrane receptor protein involved in Fe transport
MTTRNLRLARVATALSILLGVCTPPAIAQQAPPAGEPKITKSGDDKSHDDELKEIVVTGSLIPRLRSETSTPLTVISAEDIQVRGFNTVAEALERTSFATGSVQGPEYGGNGFTPSAHTLSLFGLSQSYVKYLLDGRPMADYPALYNGTDIFVNIDGIPTVLVDHIDVLPGAQSSIYGSDAIAGVVNIVLKKKLDAPLIDARIGGTRAGGGQDKRLAIGDSFDVGGLTVMLGGQYQKTEPIWGYQRGYTSGFYDQGSSPEVAGRNFYLQGLANDGNQYYFEDPTHCGNVAGLFGGTTREYTFAGSGQYCGSDRSGYYTLANTNENTQGYVRLSDDWTDHFTTFAEVLVSHEVARYNAGLGYYATNIDSNSPFYNYFDPNLQDSITLFHGFAPEEAGKLEDFNGKNTNNLWRASAGLKGSIGSSKWTYDADFTYSENRLTEITPVFDTTAIESFFAPIFGPQLQGSNPYGVYNYAPNYSLFYKPVSPAAYAAFSAFPANYSRVEESLLRGQLTNSGLFALAGGDAGFAAVLETGVQGWDYAPNAMFVDGQAFGFSNTEGSGHRSRYAATTELRLPLFKMLTASLSGRYDDYHVAAGNVDKPTFNLGLEFRPVETLLLRGRYGTAFKAPTLSDEFQGPSSFFAQQNDYYLCAKNGFTGTNLGNCPYSQTYFQETTSGNATLKPITAKVWDLGVAWAPLPKASITADLIHWSISNEVNTPNVDLLLRTEALCLLGTDPITSPTCQNAIAAVTRDSTGQILNIEAPKENVSNEVLTVFTTNFSYRWDADAAGQFEFEGAWSDVLKHDYTRFAGDSPDNLLTDPTQSTEFKSKTNATITWTKEPVSLTIYAEHYGSTPNYLATVNGFGTPGAGLLSPWTLVNVSGRNQVLPALELSLGINNLFNRMPPEDHSYPGTYNGPYNSTNYSVYGRTYYAEASYKFGK